MNAQNVHGGSVLRTMLGLKLVEVTRRLGEKVPPASSDWA